MNNNLEGWHSKVKKITGKNHNQAVDGRRQAPCQRNKDIRIKAIVDNFDNYTNLTALSYWEGKYCIFA